MGIKLFLCGDVMTGRGIDQILPHPGSPTLYEPYMRDARGYVRLAEQTNGPIPRDGGVDYVWGDALDVFGRIRPDARIINLETSVTASPDYWQFKGINYRMHPGNVGCLTAARIDCCVLANNHVLDWGHAGLVETLASLRNAGIRTAGAGLNGREAGSPAIIPLTGVGRVLVFGFCTASSGVPAEWAATDRAPGVNLLHDLSDETVDQIATQIETKRQATDVVIASIHWGGNWGYAIPPRHSRFAHALIDRAGVDLVHGHSSHHVQGFEVYRKKLILYGCGDFLNDYEGIEGYEDYRGDLGLMYFPFLEIPGGALESLRMVPTRIKNFRVNNASPAEAAFLRDILNREGSQRSAQVRMREDRSLEWLGPASRAAKPN